VVNSPYRGSGRSCEHPHDHQSTVVPNDAHHGRRGPVHAHVMRLHLAVLRNKTSHGITELLGFWRGISCEALLIVIRSTVVRQCWSALRIFRNRS
jgi:hypothetical protein